MHPDEHQPLLRYEAFDRHQPRSHRLWETIACFIGGVAFSAVIFLLLTMSPADAQSAELQSTQITTWQKLNEVCQGSGTKAACVRRDTLSKQLEQTGWLRSNHDVWVSPAKVRFMSVTLAKYDRQLEANLDAYYSIMPAMLTELRTQMNDAEIFAVWNESQDSIAGSAPYAMATMTELMGKLAMHYARSNDVRYTLGR